MCLIETKGGANNWGQVAKPTAIGIATFSQFGISVSISGDTITVGANQDDDAGSGSGSAFVFDRNQGGANNWGQVAKLTASDAAAGDFFGTSVSIFGDTITVGATRDNDAGTSSGSAYVFDRNQGGANNWGQVAKLTASDAAANDFFGKSVSISGDTITVGSSGSAYVFFIPPPCIIETAADVDTIISSNCTVTSSTTAGGSITVNSGAVMTIPSGVILDINFATKNLTVQAGGGVLIQAGGKIT